MEPVTIPSKKQNITFPEPASNEITINNINGINIQNSSIKNQQILENTQSTIFPDNKEESKLLKARKILSEIAKDQSDEQLQVFLTDLQFLIDSWFDYYEQQIFEGATLKQLLKEL